MMASPILEQIRQQIKKALVNVNTSNGSPLTLQVTAPKREGVQPVNGTCVVALVSDEPIEAAQQIQRRKATFKVVVWADFSETLEATQDAETLLIQLSAQIQKAVMPNEIQSHLNGLAEGTWLGNIDFGSDVDFYVIETEFTVNYRTLYFDPYVQG